MADKLTPQENKLLDPAIGIPPTVEPLPKLNDNFFWRTIEKIGAFAPWGAALSATIVWSLGLIVSEDYGWVGLLNLIPITLLLIFIPYLIRRNQKAEIARLQQHRLEQQKLRADVMRMVIEQSQRENNNTDNK
ncbi:MAG: hypothetical protein HXX08_21935 [Chloroflexi bacterium]|uniref:Uncharacterized protein n=1 Tax=Candidatus Chlorohelix allophototropha TaxID=3003348 RepID=A0A8T7M8P0_9CHLR|nr:hypothetical protein [Chloroflexota bacterium]WJW68459.1 hypothetical protein OZ401_004071 [Chloroflexota bacterium L227-S17]